MNIGAWIVWGFVSTIVLTTIMAASQGLRLTRMNLPYMLGTFFTPGPDKAKIVGFFVHLIDGWIFSLIYIAAFHSWGEAALWRGVLIGFVHGAFVLTAAMHLMPGIHPRMATEQQGPTVMRQIEPPGFLALNYGIQTPLSVMIAHVIYGAILGAFYTIPR